MAEAFIEIGKCGFLLQLPRVHGFFLYIRLEYFVVQIVNILSLDLSASLLQVQLLNAVLLLEINVCLNTAISSWCSETLSLGEVCSRLR